MALCVLLGPPEVLPRVPRRRYALTSLLGSQVRRRQVPWLNSTDGLQAMQVAKRTERSRRTSEADSTTNRYVCSVLIHGLSPYGNHRPQSEIRSTRGVPTASLLNKRALVQRLRSTIESEVFGGSLATLRSVRLEPSSAMERGASNAAGYGLSSKSGKE